MPFFIIWWMIAALPFVIFHDGTHRFADWLKKKNIYDHWDIWHSFLVTGVIALIVFYFFDK